MMAPATSARHNSKRGACAVELPARAGRRVTWTPLGGYLDRTYDGLLGPTRYRAYLPHGIVGWTAKWVSR